MLIDVSSASPIILQVIIGVLLVFGLIKGLKDGIILVVLRLALYVGVGVAAYMFHGTVGEMIAGTGILENLLAQLGDNPISDLIGGLITETFYSVLAAILMVIVGVIIVKVILFLIRTIFKKKGAVVRILGGIVSLAFNFAIASVILICVSSPLLFNGGAAWIENSTGVKEVYGVVNLMQTQLRTNGIPSTFEDLVAMLILGPDADSEDLQRYQETFERVNQIVADPESYVAQFLNNDFTFDSENVDILINDLIVFSEILDVVPTSETTLIPQIETMVNDFLANVPSGETVEIPADLYNALETALAQAGFGSEFQTDLLAFFTTPTA